MAIDPDFAYGLGGATYKGELKSFNNTDILRTTKITIIIIIIQYITPLLE